MAQTPKRKRGRPPGLTNPVVAAAARANGRRMKAAAPAVDEKLDALAAAERMASRITAEADLLYSDKVRMSRRERTKELRQLARALAGLIPKARLREAERVVRGEVEKIASPSANPSTEPIPEGED